MSEETIRTSMTRVIQDTSAPEGVRELAVEVLHWRLRDRFLSDKHDRTSDDRVTIRFG